MQLLQTLQRLIICSSPLQLNWLDIALHLAPVADRLSLADGGGLRVHGDNWSLSCHWQKQWERDVTCEEEHKYKSTLWTFKQALGETQTKHTTTPKQIYPVVMYGDKVEI